MRTWRCKRSIFPDSSAYLRFRVTSCLRSMRPLSVLPSRTMAMKLQNNHICFVAVGKWPATGGHTRPHTAAT